jgi:tRNA1(Val) A37 N6-methylase TrmN6
VWDARETESFDQRFQVIICNPPFFAADASRPSPHPEKQAAHQDETLTLDDLFQCALRNLAKEGRIYTIFPNDRLQELKNTAEAYGYRGLSHKNLPYIRKRNGGVSLISFI